MLSICVPIFNFDVSELFASLNKQIIGFEDSFEIISIDDASNMEYNLLNFEICSSCGTYVELPENIGRAAIRNLFLNYAKGEYLLFLDCDSKIVDDNFLSNYLKKLKISKNEIVYGGRIYPEKKPRRNVQLRWFYGLEREVKTVDERALSPYLSFQTNNFIIRRDVFEQIKFDENLRNYGHEDTLFAFDLERKNIKIEHYKNPVLNGELETNFVFVEKTKRAVENLLILKTALPASIFESISLIKYSLKYFRILKLISVINFVTVPILEYVLKNGLFVSSKILNIYKLLYYIKLSKNE